jgi:hypothetical protein
MKLHAICTAVAIVAVSLTAAENPAASAAATGPSVPYAPKQSDRPQPVTGDEPGFESIFDGKTLNGWKGHPTYWRVEDGALVGEITPQTVGDNAELAKVVTEDWNQVHLIIRGNTLIHIVNNQVMTVVIDDDAANRAEEGQIGVQVHVGPPMKVEYRNIRLKKF